MVLNRKPSAKATTNKGSPLQAVGWFRKPPRKHRQADYQKKGRPAEVNLREVRASPRGPKKKAQVLGVGEVGGTERPRSL